MQVKFRGKTESDEWVYGYLFEDEDGCFIKQSKRSHRYGSGIAVNPESIGMFTGLHDMYGNEIYGAVGAKGGDILKSITYMHRPELGAKVRHVTFYEGCFYSGYVSLKVLDISFKPEVIGNRFDNPELLEQ